MKTQGKWNILWYGNYSLLNLIYYNNTTIPSEHSIIIRVWVVESKRKLVCKTAKKVSNTIKPLYIAFNLVLCYGVYLVLNQFNIKRVQVLIEKVPVVFMLFFCYF